MLEMRTSSVATPLARPKMELYWRRYYRRYGYAAPYAYYPPAHGYYPPAYSYSRQRTFIGRTPIMRHTGTPCLTMHPIEEFCDWLT